MASTQSAPSKLEHALEVSLSSTASTFTAWRGTFVEHAAKQPPKPLRLYELESSPACRRVRETLTALGLDCEIRPCPKLGTRFRLEAKKLAGRDVVPLLVDENTGAVIAEADPIIRHLLGTYGTPKLLEAHRTSHFEPLSRLANATRLGRGRTARPSQAPDKPLELWSFESSPFSRLVRERLSELELPYTLHNLGKEEWKELGPAVRRITPNPYVPREGGKRHAFWKKHGRVQVPYLEDPNTGFHGFESAKILEYLEKTYAL